TVPNTTRRALKPDNGTSSARPRLAQAARKGGNSSRSVSSSNSLTQRAGNCRKRRRMRRFFVALGVWVQDVARSLPDVAQVVQLAADGARGEAACTPGGQLLLQEAHGPRDCLVAEARGRLAEAFPQSCLEILGPDTRVVAAPVVRQGGGVLGLAVAR